MSDFKFGYMSSHHEVAADPVANEQVDCGGQSFVLCDQPTSQVVATIKSDIESEGSGLLWPKSLSKPRAVFFDMDMTLIEQESLDEVAKRFGRFAEVSTMTARAMEGGMTFGESLQRRIEILRGMPRSILSEVSHSLRPGVKEFFALLRGTSIPYYLITGGFHEIARPLANYLGFRKVVAHDFLWDGGNQLVGVAPGPLIDADGKLDAVEQICRELGCSPADCVALGDGANDRKMLARVGLGFGVNPKKTLRSVLLGAEASGHYGLIDAAFRNTLGEKPRH